MAQIIRAGTVAVAGGETAVVGAGTGFALAGAAGGLFFCQGEVMPVASVEDDTHLTLALPWTGLGSSGASSSCAPTSRPG